VAILALHQAILSGKQETHERISSARREDPPRRGTTRQIKNHAARSWEQTINPTKGAGPCPPRIKGAGMLDRYGYEMSVKVGNQWISLEIYKQYKQFIVEAIKAAAFLGLLLVTAFISLWAF